MVHRDNSTTLSLFDGTEGETVAEFFNDNTYRFFVQYKNGGNDSSMGSYEVNKDTLYCYSDATLKTVYTHGKLVFLSDSQFEMGTEIGKELYEKVTGD